MSRGLARGMIEQGGGKIVNISSNATFYGTPDSGPYAASKAGVNQLTKTMAIEWGRHNIQVNAICPTITMTDLGKRVWDDPQLAEMRSRLVSKIPLGRFLEPEEIAPLVLFLAGPSSQFINGAIIPIDGGGQHSP